jgi:hypothetical protein
LGLLERQKQHKTNYSTNIKSRRSKLSFAVNEETTTEVQDSQSADEIETLEYFASSTANQLKDSHNYQIGRCTATSKQLIIVEGQPTRPLLHRSAYLNTMKELIWDPKAASLDEFLAHACPSKVWRPIEWIVVNNYNLKSVGYVDNPVTSCNIQPMKNRLKVLEQKVHLGHHISREEKYYVLKQLMESAYSQRYTLGKWVLIFSVTDRLDEYWKCLAEKTANGSLGCSIRIAPAKHLRSDSFERVICSIYVRDFTDLADVKRVWLGIKKVGFGHFGVRGFKPEVFSDCGISLGNVWRLPSNLYSFNDTLAWDRSNN